VENEREILEKIKTAVDDVIRDDLLEDLALHYISTERDASKAIALVDKIKNRRISYVVKMLSANHDDALSYKEKIEQYKKLLLEFPDHKGDLDYLINESEKMVRAGLVY
jgi:hypothetical protein